MRRKKIQFVVIVCILVFGLSCIMNLSLYAGDTDEYMEFTDISDVSIDNLLNVDITTASKKVEKSDKAPGVVTTISGHEIMQFGANNLIEVIDRIPGFYGIWSQLFPQNGFAVRGDFPNHVNTHILLLINGRPIRESIVGGFNLGLYTTFPLEAIERIEVIRGPGSVLYGTNAYSGVVNIITRKKVDHALGLSFGGGTLGTTKGTVSTALKSKSDQLSFKADFNFFKETGWEFGAYLAPGVWRNGKYGEEVYSGNITANLGDLSMNAFFGTNLQGIVVPMPGAVYGKHRSKRLFLDLGYKHKISKVWTSGFNVTYNRLDDAFTGPSGSHQTPLSNDIVLELTNYISPNKKINILFGGSVNFQSGQNGTNDQFAVKPYKQTWWNAYLQADYQPTESLKLIVGGQINKPNNVALDFVPRVGLIFNLTKRFGAKLLYGQAFRSAFNGETRFIIPVALKGNPNLVPEKVDTFDAQLFYSGDKLQLSTTYFYSKQKNLITRIPSPDPNFRLEFSNQGTLKLHGVELETKYVPSKNIYLLGSIAYQTNEDDKGIKDVTHIPNLMIKTGISYTHKTGISIGIFNSFYSKPSQVTVINPNAAIVNPVPQAFNNLSANIRFNIPKLLNLSNFPSLYLDIYGTNLLDEKIYNAEMVFRTTNSVPGRAGRAIYASMKLNL